MLFKMIHIKRNNYFGSQDMFVTMCRHLFGRNSAACKFRMWIYASGREEKKSRGSELLLSSCYCFLCLLRAPYSFTGVKNWKGTPGVIWSILLQKDKIKLTRTDICQ